MNQQDLLFVKATIKAKNICNRVLGVGTISFKVNFSSWDSSSITIIFKDQSATFDIYDPIWDESIGTFVDILRAKHGFHVSNIPMFIY